MKLSQVLEAIKRELKKPLPEPRVVSPKAKKERKMAKKAKQIEDDEERDDADESEDEGDEEEAAPKKAKKGKKAAKPAKKAAAAEDEEGYVSIATLAEEAGINAQSARVKLREGEVDKPEGGRWRWKDGSKALKAARKAIGL